MATDVYECDQCGACCKALIIEIDHIDVVREPRLLPVATLLDGRGEIVFESEWDKQYSIACGKNRPCGMLTADNRCSIYPTRPNVCVAHQAGSDQCQEARESMCLQPLAPVAPT